ncbi:cytochrome c biogenesis protein CcsA [Blattabacterium cuenoti]|uniref:cytochrome c biogenesis protein CcsA n=1 Tax=Blattabacterium cuenoti TaxID=1653831 RepID=UPI00163C4C0A|nr:cytochrome c biogenesis protein CcsA [Blattabacterium cuenoti]
MKPLKKIISFIFSNKITSILFIILAFSMAIATIIEQKYSTDLAKIFVYESTWFEMVMLLMIINLIGNIWKYKLWNYNKFPLFIFHVSFAFIFIGGIFSRYYSFEGIMSLRKGNINQKIISRKNYIKLKIHQGIYTKTYHDPYILSSYHKKYERKFMFKDYPLNIKIIDYIPSAKIILTKKEPVYKIIRIISISKKGRIEHFIKDKDTKNINGIVFSLNKKIPFGIQIFDKKKKIYIKSSFPTECINMGNKKRNFLLKNISNILKVKKLYQIKIDHKIIHWVIPEGIVKGRLEYIESHNQENQDTLLSAITAIIYFQKKSKLVTFLGGKNTTKMSSPILFNKDCLISIGYGSIFLNLPFFLQLNEFQVKHYPGSNLPSSFVSNVTLIDKKKRKNYFISMNNILIYKGYRFFQSGYDPDEKGTYFSVNNDYLGTYFSYIGYILMSIGMVMTLFWKGSRFSFLKKKLKYFYNKNLLLLFIFLLIISKSHFSFAKIHELQEIPLGNISDAIHIPKKHGEKFGRLLIQDPQGRIKPVNTMAIELLRKVHKKNNSIGNIDANQWFISIHQDNIFWSKVPFIKVDKKGGLKFLNRIRYNSDYYVSLINLYTIDQKTLKLKFILQEDYEKAFSKDPMQRNEYDKAVLRLSERVGIIHEIFQGKYLRIFPIPNDSNHTWESWIVSNSYRLNPEGFSMFNNYLKSLFLSQREKNWMIADDAINKIQLFQLKHAKSILPSKNKINIEIIYNKINIFYILFFLYAFLGIIIIINSFFILFFQKKYMYFFSKIFVLILFSLFIFNSLGLISRWYISGHAPWTNGYESAIFISWCLIAIGFLFYKNTLIPGITSVMASILLMIANGSIMDPEITNLSPVLKSKWLIIHVATITSSYGFFFTGSFLGFFVFILYILQARFHSYSKRIQIHMEKLTIINEICLTMGLFLLTIGTFLGSVWANNSWGRYWSWDPKETWALISIMVYAFVLHIRLVVPIGNMFIFNLFSLLSISSIIMTYFGVNYYLSGLHSYAKGAPITIPYWIYYSLLILICLSTLAYYSKFYTLQKKIDK